MKQKFCRRGHAFDLVGRTTDGRCKSCRTEYLNSDKYKKNHKAYYKKWVQENKEHYDKTVRSWNFKRDFGITIDDYTKMFNNQNGLCAVCNRSQTNCVKKLAVDHDHKTGKIRALLCANCNLTLGLVHDDPEILKKLISYLENYNRILN